MKNLNETVTTNNNLNKDNYHKYIYVARNIIHKRKITLEYAAKRIGTDENVTPDEKLLQLTELKECCRDSFTSQLEMFMSDEIQNQRIEYDEIIGSSSKKCLARTIRKFKTAIKQNYSLSFLEKVYHVLYGSFDVKPGWARTLEKNYMESKKN